uniref:Uncharacterized protein n=1 Tax=Picea sitchensis TaxID=3332 RepID=A9P1X9_PICSI|nr:unknown [Picea sitchensis]
MLDVLDILCSLVLCIPSCRNIPLMLKQLSALVRGLKLLLQRTASDMRRIASDMRGAAYDSASYVSSTYNYSYGITSHEENNYSYCITSHEENNYSSTSGIPWNDLVSSYPVGFA